MSLQVLPDACDIWQIVSERGMEDIEGVWKVGRDMEQRWGDLEAPIAHLDMVSFGPGAIFSLVLRNLSSCLSRTGKNRLLPACWMIASKPLCVLLWKTFPSLLKTCLGA